MIKLHHEKSQNANFLALIIRSCILLLLYLQQSVGFINNISPPVSPGDRGQQGGRGDSDDHLWEWWHTMLIVCIAVVIILGIIVAVLIVVSYID